MSNTGEKSDMTSYTRGNLMNGNQSGHAHSSLS